VLGWANRWNPTQQPQPAPAKGTFGTAYGYLCNNDVYKLIALGDTLQLIGFTPQSISEQVQDECAAEE